MNKTTCKRSVVVADALKSPDVKARFRRNVIVHPVGLPPLRAPFAYQNGTFNLIRPVRFAGKAQSEALKEASVCAIEGEYLKESPDATFGKCRIVVVGQFDEEQKEFQHDVRSMFENRQVNLYTEETLANLVKDIREHSRRVA